MKRRVVARVLVPLADEAPLHRGRLDRHQLDERLGGDDHAADVLADVAREAGELRGQLDQVAPERRVGLAAGTPAAGQLLAGPLGAAGRSSLASLSSRGRRRPSALPMSRTALRSL